MNSILRRRRGMMGVKSAYTPLTKITSNGTQIDTGIILSEKSILTIRYFTPNESGNRTIFTDSLSYVTQTNRNFYVRYLFGENFSQAFADNGTANIVLNCVDKTLKVSWAAVVTATAYAQATNSVKVGPDSKIGILYVKEEIDGVIVHNLLPYLFKGKPGLLDVITNEFHTVAEGGTDWNYE